MTENEDDWCEPFLSFLLHQRALEDKAEQGRMTRRSANYVAISNDLYRKAASTDVLMKCILGLEGLQLLVEIHGGECGWHTTSANLVGKAY
jgi:hypothetical protein